MRYKLLGGVVALLLVVAGACGGGKSSNSSTATTVSGPAGAVDATGCAAAGRAMAAAASSMRSALTGESDELKTSVKALKSYAASAPRAIRADLQTVAAAYGRMATALADSNFDPRSGQSPSADMVRKLTEAGAAVDTDAVRSATARVSAWFNGGCK